MVVSPAGLSTMRKAAADGWEARRDYQPSVGNMAGGGLRSTFLSTETKA